MTKGNNSNRSCDENHKICKLGNFTMGRESFQDSVTRPSSLESKVMKTGNQLEDMISKMTISDLDICTIVKDFQNIKINSQISENNKAESDDENDPEASDDEHSEHSETDSDNNHSRSEDENETAVSDKTCGLTPKKDDYFSHNSLSDNGDVIVREKSEGEDKEPGTLLDENLDEDNAVIMEKNSSEQATESERSNIQDHSLSTIKEGFESEFSETLKERYEFEDTAEKEEEEKYLTRGLLTHNKSNHRFSPIHHSSEPNSHSYYRNNDTLTNNESSQEKISNIFDIIDFNDAPKEAFSQYQMLQNDQISSRAAGQEYSNDLNLSSFAINSDINLYQNNTFLAAQNNDWNAMSSIFYPDNTCDYPNNLMYQPPTPPKSVSPMLKESFEGNLFDSPVDNYNVKKSEDLINIINAINLANKTEPSGIPEAELEKLRSVLESNDDFIRNEMDMYLAKDNESIIQQKDIMPTFNTQPTNILEDVQDDCNYWFDGEPLTPPSSIPPAQDGCSSPAWEQDEITQLCSEEHLSDIINGIDEINPDELNIYLEKEKLSIYDTSYAKTWLQKKCKPNALDYAFRRLSQTSNKVICKKDRDGDTGLMIVYSQPENSSDFYENIFCMQEIVREIKVCCEIPLGKAKRCKSCGNSDPSRFYTPLSFKNNQGYSALCCAVKTNLSTVIVDYLIDGILQNEEDVRRVFDATGKAIFAEFCNDYPSLKRYI